MSKYWSKSFWSTMVLQVSVGAGIAPKVTLQLWSVLQKPLEHSRPHHHYRHDHHHHSHDRRHHYGSPSPSLLSSSSLSTLHTLLASVCDLLCHKERSLAGDQTHPSILRFLLYLYGILIFICSQCFMYFHKISVFRCTSISWFDVVSKWVSE